jgi:BatD DUF11 like domain
MKRIPTLALLVGLAPASAFAAAHATLDSTTLAVGVAAQLSVTVDGTASAPPSLSVPGASVRLADQMSRVETINGATTQQTTYVYALVPNRTGALEIPAIAVATSNGTETTDPLHATVTDAPAPVPSTAIPRATSARAFVTFDVPTKALVVGQAVPVKIHAFFRGGTSATLQGLPHVTSDAFTLSELSDKPAQAQIELRGEPYLEATWTATLSPAKPSSGPVGVELPVELAYRAAAKPQHRSLRDIFGADPFADSIFGGDADPFGDLDTMFDIGPMQQYQTTLHATVGKVTVAELPAAGKPAGFTGAVGHFDLAVEPVGGEPRVGEPLTLTVRVSGTGNFDRVAVTGARDAEGYKTYSTNAAFAPASPDRLTGAKTFTQTIVPTRAGDMTIAPLAFDYFDPAKHAYATARTNPVIVRVAAAPDGAPTARATAVEARGPIDGSSHATLEPLIRQTKLWLELLGLLVLTAMLAAAGWSRRSPRIARVLRERRIDRAVDREVAAMHRAVAANDRHAFFIAARSALQSRLAATWKTAPDAITAYDVAIRLGERGASIGAVFEQADGVTYGRATNHEPLEHWQHVVRDELASWKAAS